MRDVTVGELVREAHGNRRLLFVCPDHDVATGGIRQIYRVVESLVKLGIRAFVVHRKRPFQCTWFVSSAEVLYADELTLGSEDVAVIPEIWARLARESAMGIPHIIFCQNPFYAFHGHVDSSDFRKTYESRAVLAVIVVSEHSRNMLQFAAPDAQVIRIRCGIDTDLFAPCYKKERIICYMARKRAEEANELLVLIGAGSRLAGWEVCNLQGLSENEVAAALKRCAIFLAFGHREGFGLPPAEALAAGCAVVGFDGFGGSEIFALGGIRVEDGDTLLFAAAVLKEMRRVENNDPSLLDEARVASEAVRAHFSLDAQREDLRQLADLPAAQDLHRITRSASLALQQLWPARDTPLGIARQHMRTSASYLRLALVGLLRQLWE